MSRPFKPMNTPTLFPYMTVQNVEETVAFYTRAFGFELKEALSKVEDKVMHAELAFQDTLIMLAAEGAWNSQKKSPKTSGVEPSLALYVYVPDVDAFFKHAKANGAEEISTPEDMFWGDRFCQFRDIDGYEWSFATNVAEHGPKPA